MKGNLGSFGLRIVILMAMFLSGALGAFEAWADKGISLSTGYGAAHIVPLRLGFQKTFDKGWNKESSWPISGYWEGSLYHKNGNYGSKPGSNKRLNALALAGVIRFERAQEIVVGWPYVEFGIGLSWLSRKEIGGRDLGMHPQFEDRFGIGVRFGQNREYDIGYKAVHFSNAYIGPCNHGINLHIITLGYWFK